MHFVFCTTSVCVLSVCAGVISYLHVHMCCAGCRQQHQCDFYRVHVCVCMCASAGIFGGVTGINSALGPITVACPGDRQAQRETDG